MGRQANSVKVFLEWISGPWMYRPFLEPYASSPLLLAKVVGYVKTLEQFTCILYASFSREQGIS